MKRYNKIDDDYVLIENDGEAPRVVNIQNLQMRLKFLRSQKSDIQEKIDKVQEEIAEALITIQNNSPK